MLLIISVFLCIYFSLQSTESQLLLAEINLLLGEVGLESGDLILMIQVSLILIIFRSI